MTHIVFVNDGEIDTALITTFGANVKVSESPIGFFGTGMKYALAILAREGIPVTIYSGMKRLIFSPIDRVLRGKEFSFVAMNGQPLSFTTELGKQWDLWMAYRELYCNAIDEGGRMMVMGDAPVPVPGTTIVAISDPRFTDIARNHDRYFIGGRELICDTKHAAIYRGGNSSVFYRGVGVGQATRAALQFTYDLHAGVQLGEDRLIKSEFEAKYNIGKALVQCNDRKVIKDAVTAADMGEAEIYFENTEQPSAEFMDVVGELIEQRIADVNNSAVNKYLSHAPKRKPKQIDLNATQEKALARAIEFCGRIQFPVGMYPITVSESLGAGVLGLAHDDQIYISVMAFDRGMKCLIGTLIEEYIHLRLGHEDMTRAMQNYLIDKMLSFAEQVTGDPL